MTAKIDLHELEELAIYERLDHPDWVQCEYIGYLWWKLQDYDEKIAADLQRDYKRYLEEVEAHDRATA